MTPVLKLVHEVFKIQLARHTVQEAEACICLNSFLILHFENEINWRESHSNIGKSQATHIDCRGTRFGWCIPNQTYPPWSPLDLDHLLDSTIHLSFQMVSSTFWHDSFLDCVQLHAQRYWLVLVARFFCPLFQ